MYGVAEIKLIPSSGVKQKGSQDRLSLVPYPAERRSAPLLTFVQITA